MQLDQLVGLPAPREVVEAAMERTLRWGERSLAARNRAISVAISGRRTGSPISVSGVLFA